MKTFNARQIQKEKILGLDTNLQRQVLVNSKGLEFLHSKWILISLMTGQEYANSLLKHKAVWHKSCRNKINSTELKRAEKRKQKEETPEAASPVKTRRLSSSSTKSNKGKCFFCNEASSGLRSAATDTITHRVRSSATLLQDTELLAKLAAGSDMVAIDGEYHPKCLAALYNRVRQQ